MRKHVFKIAAIFLCLNVVCLNMAGLANAQEAAAKAVPSTDMSMIVGDMETIPVHNLTRVSVTNPDIADISDAQPDKVTVVGKKLGQTVVFLWDEEGKQTVLVRVAEEDLQSLQGRMANLLSKTDIKGVRLETNAAEGKVVVYGELSKEQKGELDKILDPYADQVINLTKEVVNEELIQIDMQITELGTTLDKKMGVDWQAGAKGAGLALDYKETGAPTDTGSKDWFKFGQFNRTTAIINTINLLINEGKARDLSRPRLLVTSGKEATINVGGEIPIQSTTTNATGGATQSNVTFKQYGVTLTVTPTVRDGKIDVLMNIQVSDIDKTFFIAASTNNDVAFKTRSAQTQLLLDDRQTVVFAGLIRYNDGEQVKKVPFLGNLPLVGGLFRNRSKAAPDEGKELVITLTPSIMRKKEYTNEQVKLPTKAMVDFVKEVDTNKHYEHEALKNAPPVEQPVKMNDPAPAMPAVKQMSAPATPYVRSIQTKISQAISYPYEALENNWQGTVKLKLHILKDGSLSEASVVQSSGHEVFDQDALNSAKIAAPYPPFTADFTSEDLIVTVPIVYSQNVSSNPSGQTVVASY